MPLGEGKPSSVTRLHLLIAFWAAIAAIVPSYLWRSRKTG